MTAPSPAPLMLSVSGCRGIVGASLTAEGIARYTAAAASWLKATSKNPNPTIILANDGRRGGDILRTLAGACLASNGCNIIDLGIATTPTVGVMVVHHKADAGITLTASHNPGEWNGLKIISRQGAAPDAAQAKAIIDLFHGGARADVPATNFGTITHDTTSARTHVDRVLHALSSVADIEEIRKCRFKVVVDSVNASGTQGARLLLDQLGCQLIHLFDDSSGIFPHTPEPTAENLKGLCAEITKHRADVGFAQDPDADRLAIIDANGRYIGEEYTLVLSAMALLGSAKHANNSAAPATLVANLSTSRMLDDVVARLGGRVLRSAVGEANVVSLMQQSQALMGGEGNGGVIWPAVTLIRDSLSAMALTLALLARERKPLHQLIDAVPAYAIEKRKLELKPGLTERALAAAHHIIPNARIDTQDGVRLDFPAPAGNGHAWLHIRASNTEPILRLIAEAPTQAEATTILDNAQRAISAA